MCIRSARSSYHRPVNALRELAISEGRLRPGCEVLDTMAGMQDSALVFSFFFFFFLVFCVFTHTIVFIFWCCVLIIRHATVNCILFARKRGLLTVNSLELALRYIL